MSIRLAVDEPAANADIIYLTSLPHVHDLNPSADVWAARNDLADGLMRAGVSAERIRVVELGPDPDFWTPDGAFIRPEAGPLRILVGPEAGWREAIIALFETFGPADRVSINVLLGEPGPRDQGEVQRVVAGLFNAYGKPDWQPAIGASALSASPSLLSRELGANDLVLATGKLPTHLRARLESIGLPIVDVSDRETLRRLATDEAARAAHSRTVRATALRREAERGRCFGDICDASLLLHGPHEGPVPNPRIFVAPAPGCSDADIMLAREHALFAVALVGEATHVAVVDGDVDLPPGWDAMLLEVLEQHPRAALASTCAPKPDMTPLTAAIFSQGAGELRVGGPVPRGARLARADETRIAPIWIASEVMVAMRVEPAVAAARI
jgi:hypothetical protein